MTSSDVIQEAAVPPAIDTGPQKRFMAFEMQTGGHHPSYIRNFAEQWVERQLPARLDFVVTPRFFERHAEAVERVNALDPDRVGIASMTEAEQAFTDEKPLLREFRGWNLFCEYAERFAADHAMLMYSDHFQLPMVLGRSAPCGVSCIYFRPTFHYGMLPNYHPTFKQRLVALRKKLLLKRLLKLRQLECLFCMDAMAATYIRQHLKPQPLVTTMPDSFALPPTPEGRVEQLRRELGIEPGRRVLMSLGILDSRKGPLQLLAAVKALPAETQSKLCLLLIGKLDESLEREALAEMQWINEQTPAQVISHNGYIPDTQVQPYYELADVALTTYQGHMGMSSALIRAALAGIPILSSSYGLMGDMVRRHELGVVVDTTSPAAFTDALRQVLHAEPTSLFDPQQAQAFAGQHAPDAVGQTLADWVSRAGVSVPNRA